MITIHADDPRARTRRLLRAGVCPACGRRPRRWPSLFCTACRPLHGYCARCEGVLPREAFAPATPSRAARGATVQAYCRACNAERSHRASGRCARCQEPLAANRRLCQACRETHGYCPNCKRVKELRAFGPPTPARLSQGCRHAIYCRVCERARKRAHYHEARHAD